MANDPTRGVGSFPGSPADDGFPRGYREGFVKGYQDGIEDGRIQGFQDAKRLAYQALADDSEVREALERAIGEL